MGVTYSVAVTVRVGVRAGSRVAGGGVGCRGVYVVVTVTRASVRVGVAIRVAVAVVHIAETTVSVTSASRKDRTTKDSLGSRVRNVGEGRRAVVGRVTALGHTSVRSRHGADTVSVRNTLATDVGVLNGDSLGFRRRGFALLDEADGAFVDAVEEGGLVGVSKAWGGGELRERTGQSRGGKI